jgi:DNA polymerase-3 subunit delta'
MIDFSSLALHPNTKQNLLQFIASDNHALLVVGPKGSGKKTILEAIAVALGAKRQEQRIVVSDSEPSISINQARSLRTSLGLRPLKDSVLTVMIPSAEKLTIEAQNALLKLLEEPPENTYFLLSTEDKSSLLPTVLSRVNVIRLNKLSSDQITDYFLSHNYEEPKIKVALALSGGYTGLAKRLLDNQAEDFKETISNSKQILSSSLIDRLLLIEGLTKDKLKLKNLKLRTSG